MQLSDLNKLLSENKVIDEEKHRVTLFKHFQSIVVNVFLSLMKKRAAVPSEYVCDEFNFKGK